MKVKTKLQLVLLFVAAVCILLTGWQAFRYSRTTIESITYARLTSIREMKKKQIESYFRQMHNQSMTLASERTTQEAIDAFSAGLESLRTSHTPEEIRALLRFVATSARLDPVTDSYQKALLSYHSTFSTYAKRFGYRDIFLADAETGDILYSTSGNAEVASSLLRNTSTLAHAFKQAREGGMNDSSYLVDFAAQDAMSPPVAYIAAPVLRANKKIGVLLFELSIRDINALMTSGAKWQDEGLGVTGETYIVGEDFLLRNDSRFAIQDSAAYYQRLERLGTDASTIARIRSKRTTILLQSARTKATLDALQGNTNTCLVKDYQGISALSSYTPLDIPGIHWVILAEMDAREAFASVDALRDRIFVVGILLLLLAFVIGLVFSRMISRPLVALTAATELFGKDGVYQRVPDSSSDEIGLLARTINRMNEGMSENTELLRKEIDERKSAEDELRNSREELRSLSTHLQSVREEERQGVAREIHDELGQALSSLKLDIALMKEELHHAPEEAERRIASMSELCDTTIRSVRRIITQLRPRLLNDLGLTAAVEWQAEEFQERTGIECTLSILPEEITLDDERSTAIFRIFQETLTNVSRHANATSVNVELRLDESGVTLEVCDNGRGIPAQQIHNPKSFGLLGIRERAHYWGGSVAIEGEQGRGTTVSVYIPGDFL